MKLATLNSRLWRATVLLCVLCVSVANSQEPKAPGEGARATQTISLTEEEKKDLVILNQGLEIQAQAWQLTWNRCGPDSEKIRELVRKAEQEYARLQQARAALAAKIAAAKGPDVVCDAEKLECRKAKPSTAENAKDAEKKKK